MRMALELSSDIFGGFMQLEVEEISKYLGSTSWSSSSTLTGIL